MLNFHLVVFRCAMDDIPCQAFAFYPDAMDYAEDLSEPPEQSLKVMGPDPSLYHCNVSIITFENGVPVDLHYVKEIL